MSDVGLQVLVLGELTAIVDGSRIAVPGSRKTRALLGYLLLQDRPVTREHLCELLWPHPDNPRAALRWSLTKLRPLLNADVERLKADRSSVVIEGMSDRVDLRRINRLLRRPIDQVATEDLEAAAALFHGELLEALEIPDCHRFNEWLIAYGEAARRSHRLILETLTARLAADPEAALVHARQRVSLDPLDEGAHVDVVRLLGGLGRASEARAQAERCRKILDVELGATPGPDLDDALRNTKKVQSAPIIAAIEVRPELPTASAAGLFGRADECVRIEHFLSTGDGPSVLFLAGESGIGKSRLLAEAQSRATERDILVLAGRSWEMETVRPFGVWIELLQDLPIDLVPDDHRHGLASLMPALGEPVASSDTMERIIAAVKGLLEHLWQADRPVVLLFDDLQWIDQASAELLGAATPAVANGYLAIACAGRPGEFADNDIARSLLRTWNREGLLERLAVGPLSDKEAAALARTLSASTDIEDAVASCGGNPLYIIESVRGGGGPAAEGVAALVADRLAILDEPTREIVDWAAVMGRAFPAARLSELLDRPLADLLRQTETLERHGILRPHGNGWDFAHDLLRRSALGLMSSPRRALMHRRTAHLMSRTADPYGELAGEIVFHATRGDLPELAARSAVAAGDRALKLAAFDDAWRVADRGLLAVNALDEAEAIEIGVELLRIQVLAGRGRRDPRAMIRKLLEVSRGAAAAGKTPAVRTARWLLSIVAEESGDFDQARDHSLKAEEASRRADPQTRLKAVANTARCLLQLEREPNKAAALLDQAQALAAELESPLLDIPWGLGLLHLLKGRPDDARVALLQGAEMARDQDNHWAHFECLSRLSMLDLEVGDLDAVEERDPELRSVADKLGEGSELALTDTLLALARHRSGSDRTELESALETLRAADSKGLLAYALNEAGRLDLDAGDLERAALRAEEAAHAADEVGRPHQLGRAMRLFERINTMKNEPSINPKKGA